MTPIFGLIKMARCQEWSQGSFWEHVLREQWLKKWLTAITKSGISLPALCLQGYSSPFLCLSYILQKTRAKKTKTWGPFSPGQGFVPRSYICSRVPSPCSRLCICTCMSPACCSRWRSCCSGFDLESTHPHLKDNGNIAFSYRVQVWQSFRRYTRILKTNCFTFT